MSLKDISKKRQAELKTLMLKFRKQGEDGNQDTFRRMTEAERMKIGDQWDYNDKMYSKSRRKFALTINEVLPVVLDVAGTEENNPVSVTVRNVKAGSRKVAEILSIMSKKVEDDNNGQERRSQAFEAGVTTGRAFLAIDISYERDPLNGDYEITQKDSFMVLPDPTATSYDYNDRKNGAKFIIVDDWEDKKAVEARYPKKKKEIQSANFSIIDGQGLFGSIMNHMFNRSQSRGTKDDYRDQRQRGNEENRNVPKSENNYRVSTTWHKEYKKGVYVQNVDDPLNYLAVTRKADIKFAEERAEESDQWKVIKQDRAGNPLVVPVLNKTVMVGDVLIDHVEDPFNGVSLYPIVRFAPYFDGGYEYGIVENIIGPQKVTNYFFSSMCNWLKNLLNTGWMVKGGTQVKKQWLEENSFKDGLVIDESEFDGGVKKIVNNDFPSGADGIVQRSKENIREITQVRTEEPVKSNESGRSRIVREEQNLRTKGVIFRNWRLTNNILGRVQVELFRNTEVFSDEEIMEMVDDEQLIDSKMLEKARGEIISQLQAQGVNVPGPPNADELSGLETAQPGIKQAALAAFQAEQQAFEAAMQKIDQLAIPMAKEMMLAEIRSMQKGRYGVKIDTAPTSPTMRAKAQVEGFALDERLIAAGRPGLSRTDLIKLTDIKNKEELIANVPEIAQQGAA